MKNEEDLLNKSRISIIEETNSNLMHNIEYEENISNHLRESKTSYEKKALKDEIIGFDYGSDYSRSLASIEQEAVEYKKTIIVFVTPNDPYYDSTRDF